MGVAQQTTVEDLSKIILLLQADQIYTPKALMRMGLHERSVLLVSEIITDNRFKSFEDVKSIVESYAEDSGFLLAYSFDNKKTARRMKRDLEKVAASWYEIFNIGREE